MKAVLMMSVLLALSGVALVAPADTAAAVCNDPASCVSDVKCVLRSEGHPYTIASQCMSLIP